MGGPAMRQPSLVQWRVKHGNMASEMRYFLLLEYCVVFIPKMASLLLKECHYIRKAHVHVSNLREALHRDARPLLISLLNLDLGGIGFSKVVCAIPVSQMAAVACSLALRLV